VPGTLVGVGAFGVYTGSLDLQPTDTIWGFDPMFMLGLGGLGSAVVGFFGGAAMTGVLWRAFNGRKAAQMDARQRQFHQHITRLRAPADTIPLSGVPGTKSPDFYGEKIKSLADYRAWLRQQREQCRRSGRTSPGGTVVRKVPPR